MRETIVTPIAGGSVSVAVTLIRDERRQITVTGMGAEPLVLAISATPGGAPLIEVPGTGQFDLAPAAMQVLTEGSTYNYNIWQKASGDLILIAAGQLVIAPSIAPAGADYPTTFLSGFGQVGGPSQVVALTRAAYAALPVKDPATIYMITD